MSTTKQIPEGINLPDGWVCEMHTRGCDVLVAFTPSVVHAFGDYDSRHELTGAVTAEINEIPSSHIPYGTFDFKQMMFVYSAFWSEEDNRWEIDIDLAANMVAVGHM